jgi:N-acetylglutamate synthase-like GNAT family acetyltransferase
LTASSSSSDEHDLVAPPGQRPAEHPLAVARAISVGSVEKGHSEFECAPNRAHRLVVVDRTPAKRLAVHCVPRAANGPTAETQRADFDPGRAEHPVADHVFPTSKDRYQQAYPAGRPVRLFARPAEVNIRSLTTGKPGAPGRPEVQDSGMTEIRPATRADLRAVVSLIARLQADPAHHIGFYGDTEEDIADELTRHDPQWPAGVVVALASGGGLRGVLNTEVNPDLCRAWLYGPHVDVPSGHPAAPQAWHTTADALYAAALKLPHMAGIADLSLYGHVQHRQLGEFADRHGFAREKPTRIFTLAGAELRSLLAQQADRTEPLPSDGSLDNQVGVLLERCFPNRTSTTEQVLDGEHTVVVLRQGGGKLAGFAAGYVQQEEYLVDYVAVEPDMRCVGVGSQVVRGLLRELDARNGAKRQAAAVVANDNTASAAMFGRLGFQVESELVGYRRKP